MKYFPLLWFVYIIIDALVSWYLIVNKKFTDQTQFHILSTVVRMWAFVLLGILVEITEQSLLSWVLFCGSSFWVLFDPLLNIFRGKRFFYIGENAMIDRFGKSHPAFYWTLKVFALLFAIVSGFDLMR